MLDMIHRYTTALNESAANTKLPPLLRSLKLFWGLGLERTPVLITPSSVAAPPFAIL